MTARRSFLRGHVFKMEIPDIFLDRRGRLRSGWRLLIFVIIFNTMMLMMLSAFRHLPGPFLKSNWGFVVQELAFLVPAIVAGYGCGKLLEYLPFSALGWALHRGWLGDWLKGSLLGTASLGAAAAMAAASGSLHFAATPPVMFLAVCKTLLISSLIFIFGAAAEEALFRGYPLQTLLRSLPPWVAVAPPALVFAWIHTGNPNVVRGFTIINTTLAGVWLSVAYLRTRSLWFPLGLHWSWNWMMGAVLGLPVSGIERLTPAPLLHAVDSGPAWITGGKYGIEGGAACTLTLIASTIFIWRTRLMSATEEMKQWTTSEHLKPGERPLTADAEERSEVIEELPASGDGLETDG